MKEYAVEKINTTLSTSKATDTMNEYASRGWTVLRTEVMGSYLVIVFERDK